MLNPINVLRAVHKPVLDFRPSKRYAEKSIPKDADNILIPAGECLEAYNKGGLMIHLLPEGSYDINMLRFTNTPFLKTFEPPKDSLHGDVINRILS